MFSFIASTLSESPPYFFNNNLLNCSIAFTRGLLLSNTLFEVDAATCTGFGLDPAGGVGFGFNGWFELGPGTCV
jgi:hypothetical protein